MKHSNLKFRNLVPIVVLFFIVTSCNTTKYAALPCPDLPQAPKTKEIKVPKNYKIFAAGPAKNKNARKNRRKSRTNSNQISPSDNVREANNYNVLNDLPVESNLAIIHPSPQLNIQNLPPPSEEYYAGLIENVESQAYETEANHSNVKSLSPYLPKYSSSEAKKLKRTNNYQEAAPPIEGLGLAGFVVGIVGLFFAGIPLGTIAIVFGAVSLVKIKKNPQKFRGKGLALTSLILGIIDVAAMVLLIILLL